MNARKLYIIFIILFIAAQCSAALITRVKETERFKTYKEDEDLVKFLRDMVIWNEKTYRELAGRTNWLIDRDEIRGDLKLIGDEKKIYLYNGEYWWSIVAPSGLSANYAFTLPLNDGDSGQAMITDGDGKTSWSTPAGMGNMLKSTYDPCEAGKISLEAGGLEADISGYTDGLYGIAGGVTTDIDTIAEVETAIGGSTNILTEAEIDASAELYALIDDETGSGSGALAVFNQNPTLDGATFNGDVAFNSTISGSTNVITETDIDTSLKLRTILTDETGTGKAVFATGPTFTSLFVSDNGLGAFIIDGSGNFVLGSSKDMIFQATDPCGVAYTAAYIRSSEIGLARMVWNIDGSQPFAQYGIHVGTNTSDDTLISGSSTGADSLPVYRGNKRIILQGKTAALGVFSATSIDGPVGGVTPAAGTFTKVTVGTVNGGTIDKTIIGGSDPCAVTAGILTVNTSAALDGSYVWFGNSLTISDADDIETAYDALIADTTHGMGTISTTNRRKLFLMPGNYVLPSKWELDTTFVDVEGLGASPFAVVVRITGNQVGPAIEQTADDIRLSNFTASHDGTGFPAADLSATGDHAFVVNVPNMTAPRSIAGALEPTASVYTNMRFAHVAPQRNGNTISILGADDIEGMWLNCWGDTFSWNMVTNKALNGEFHGCDGDFGGFEIGVEIGGSYYGGFGTLGGSSADGSKLNSDSLFIGVEGLTLPCFGVGVESAGYMAYCNANNFNSFGGTNSKGSNEGDATGIFISNTTLGGSSFGGDDAAETGNSIQSGIFINNRNGSAGDYAAGRSGGRPSVVTDNGTAGSVTIDPDGADNDITFTSRFKSDSITPSIQYRSRVGSSTIVIGVIDDSDGQLITILFKANVSTAADITAALDANDEAKAIMTWTAGGVGVMPTTLLTVFPLSGGVNSVYFQDNHPWAPMACVVDTTAYMFDSGGTYNNLGADGAITITIDDGLFVGYEATFIRTEIGATDDLYVDLPAAAHFVLTDGTAMANGEQYRNESDNYGLIKVLCIAPNIVQIVIETGTWVEEVP